MPASVILPLYSSASCILTGSTPKNRTSLSSPVANEAQSESSAQRITFAAGECFIPFLMSSRVLDSSPYLSSWSRKRLVTPITIGFSWQEYLPKAASSISRIRRKGLFLEFFCFRALEISEKDRPSISDVIMPDIRLAPETLVTTLYPCASYMEQSILVAVVLPFVPVIRVTFCP